MGLQSENFFFEKMRLFFPALIFVVNAQNLNANAFLNLTEILLEGENVIDGFGNLFTIIENTVENAQSELNMTSSWRNLTTIVNIQQHAFQQADRFLKEIIKIMDDTEDLGQKVCFTFNEETVQVQNWLNNTVKIDLDFCGDFINQTLAENLQDDFDYFADTVTIYVTLF